MRAVLPDSADLVYAELYDDPPHLAPLPEEEPLIASSVAKRRNEFVTVRHCARVAMEQLGVPPAPILKGDKGEPRWPRRRRRQPHPLRGLPRRGGRAGGAVRSVGIDAEPHGVLPEGVLDAISLPIERYGDRLRCPASLHWDRILFCAKEATYKAWFPLTQRWLGLRGRPHHLRRRCRRHRGSFASRILIDPAARSGPPLTELDGRWSVGGGLALTAIVL